MDIFAIDSLLKTWLEKLQGEEVPDYKIARLLIDCMWHRIERLAEAKVPRKNIVGVIAICLNGIGIDTVSTRTINAAIIKKMKKEGGSFEEVSIKEATEKPLKASPAAKPEESPTTKPVAAKTPAPAAPVLAPAKVLPPIPPFKSSVVVQPPPPSPAPQINRPAIENPQAPEISIPVHLDNKESKEKPKPIFPAFYKLGTGFRGVDDVGPAAEAEKEIRRKVAASHKLFEEREKAKKLAAAEATRLAESESSTNPKGQEND